MLLTPILPAHSKLGASSYDRWGACPGSVRASEGIEKTTSIYAEEGTLAHTVASNLLGGIQPLEPVDDEMMDAVNVYLDYVQGLRSMKPTFEAVEQKLHLKDYHPDLFGTGDYICYFADKKRLHVVDYKHGRGIPVEVKNSKQLMYYGLGALHVNKVPIESITLTIVQPRCYHPDGTIRHWVTDPITMIDFAAQLIDDAKATEKIDAPLVPGDHCRFCPAQPTCPALQKQALATISGAFTDVSNLDGERLGKALAMVPQIKSWCESVNAFAYQQATLGHDIAGFKLVDKRDGNRKWKEDADAFMMGQALDKDESKFFGEPKLLSPSQVEKSLGLDKSQKEILNQFTYRESGGKCLVPVADDRAPVKGAIEAMFSTVE